MSTAVCYHALSNLYICFGVFTTRGHIQIFTFTDLLLYYKDHQMVIRKITWLSTLITCNDHANAHIGDFVRWCVTFGEYHYLYQYIWRWQWMSFHHDKSRYSDTLHNIFCVVGIKVFLIFLTPRQTQLYNQLLVELVENETSVNMYTNTRYLYKSRVTTKTSTIS